MPLVGQIQALHVTKCPQYTTHPKSFQLEEVHWKPTKYNWIIIMTSRHPPKKLLLRRRMFKSWYNQQRMHNQIDHRNQYMKELIQKAASWKFEGEIWLSEPESTRLVETGPITKNPAIGLHKCCYGYAHAGPHNWIEEVPKIIPNCNKDEDKMIIKLTDSALVNGSNNSSTSAHSSFFRPRNCNLGPLYGSFGTLHKWTKACKHALNQSLL